MEKHGLGVLGMDRFRACNLSPPSDISSPCLHTLWTMEYQAAEKPCTLALLVVDHTNKSKPKMPQKSILQLCKILIKLSALCYFRRFLFAAWS